MTPEELAQFDGRDGRKALVAVNGKIYDFTDSPLWENGLHQNQHRSGTDLTQELLQAPHVRAVVERYPVVDRLEEEPEPGKKSSAPLVTAAIILGILILLGWLLL